MKANEKTKIKQLYNKYEVDGGISFERFMELVIELRSDKKTETYIDYEGVRYYNTRKIAEKIRKKGERIIYKNYLGCYILPPRIRYLNGKKYYREYSDAVKERKRGDRIYYTPSLGYYMVRIINRGFWNF